MFIRLKTRKQGDKTLSYAYLVSSKHRKKGAKQKVIRYLGKVYSFERTKNRSFDDFINGPAESFISLKPLKTSLIGLVKLELENHDFTRISKNKYAKGKLLVNLSTKDVKDISNSKPVCIAINDGYLTSYTLSKMLNFKAPEALERDVGKALAKRILAAGVLLDQGIFVLLFQKLKRELSIR